jgi:hypothetical protein
MECPENNSQEGKGGKKEIIQVLLPKNGKMGRKATP